MTVSKAGHYACALTMAGDVVCWGDHSNRAPPGPYVDISAGTSHACALTADGEARCWYDGRWSVSRTISLPGLYSTIVAGWITGEGHATSTCGLTDEGEIDCFHGWFLGDEPPGRYVGVAFDGRRLCGLTEAGEVTCFPGPATPPGTYTAVRSPRLDTLDPVAYGGGVELLDTRGRYPNLACSGTEPGG